MLLIRAYIFCIVTFRNISTAAPTPRGTSHLSPRSARSESMAASIPEELDEAQDLDDDISDANELLKSDNSAVRF